MYKLKEAAARAAQSALQKLVLNEKNDLAPRCEGWIYQPERPQLHQTDEQNLTDT